MDITYLAIHPPIYPPPIHSRIHHLSVFCGLNEKCFTIGSGRSPGIGGSFLKACLTALSPKGKKLPGKWARWSAHSTATQSENIPWKFHD